MTTPFEFRVEGWRELSEAMASLPKGVRREIRRRMRRPAQRFVDKARSNATGQGLVRSGDLIRSIKVSITRTGVAVVAGGATAPYAKVFEGGLRHPVWGRGDNRREWTWYQEPQREFFYPAADDLASSVAAELVETVQDVAAGLGVDLTAGRYVAPSI